MVSSPQVILLNGASSSGKSTLARLLQQRLDQPYVYLAEDDFWAKFPERGRASDGAFEYRYRLYYGFLHCIAALATCGNFVIVDTVADDRDALLECARLLRETSVLFVGVHCALSVLEVREQARGDRTPGTARRQFERVHAHCCYDIEVDTSQATPDHCATAILSAARTQTAPSALFEHQKEPEASAMAALEESAEGIEELVYRI